MFGSPTMSTDQCPSGQSGATVECIRHTVSWWTSACPSTIAFQCQRWPATVPAATVPAAVRRSSVAIQVSGTFGSRQEEAQRLGRILRPKSDGGLAHFYSVVTRASRDQEFAVNRQLFLTEQGYNYRIVDAATLAAPDGPAANGPAANGPGIEASK